MSHYDTWAEKKKHFPIQEHYEGVRNSISQSQFHTVKECQIQVWLKGRTLQHTQRLLRFMLSVLFCEFLFTHKLAHITMTAFQIESNRSKNLKVLKSSNGYFSSTNAHAKHSLLNGRKKDLLNHQGHVEKPCHAVF